MDIDLSALRMLESEKDISMETSIKAIEDALLEAYHKTEGASVVARVKVDRATGHVTVWATETATDGTPAREFDDTPDGFGRIAATTARRPPIVPCATRIASDSPVLSRASFSRSA